MLYNILFNNKFVSGNELCCTWQAVMLVLGLDPDLELSLRTRWKFVVPTLALWSNPCHCPWNSLTGYYFYPSVIHFYLFEPLQLLSNVRQNILHTCNFGSCWTYFFAKWHYNAPTYRAKMIDSLLEKLVFIKYNNWFSLLLLMIENWHEYLYYRKLLNMWVLSIPLLEVNLQHYLHVSTR